MKFVKISTEYTKEEMSVIENNTSVEVMIRLRKLFRSIKYVQFKSQENKICSYAIVDDDALSAIFSEYAKIEFNFTYEDLSKMILFGNTPQIQGESEINSLNNMINIFLEEYLSLDIVLDKINELGINQLNEKDKKLLESF